MIALAILAVLSCLLNLWQWGAARLFPLHCREGRPGRFPPVTMLKPLKGADGKTRECLESWFGQDYPGPTQILFGVADPQDPVCDLVRALIVEHPERPARLVICQRLLGANAKVSSLAHMQREVEGEIVVVSDADVKAPPDLLGNLVSRFERPETGLVNCFYALADRDSFAMRWERVAVNSDFWSQVLQGRSLQPPDFALGAAMAFRKTTLEQIGGFDVLLDYLADDYQLGNRIARGGGKIELSPVVVECLSDPQGFAQVWSHQLRWARTIRVCQPAPYFFSILANATLWPLLWAAFDRGNTALAFLGFSLTLRIVASLDLQARLTRNWEHAKDFWLAPVKDLLGAAIWALSFLGGTVVWRGQAFRVEPGGKLVRK